MNLILNFINSSDNYMELQEPSIHALKNLTSINSSNNVNWNFYCVGKNCSKKCKHDLYITLDSCKLWQNLVKYNGTSNHVFIFYDSDESDNLVDEIKNTEQKCIKIIKVIKYKLRIYE